MYGLVVWDASVCELDIPGLKMLHTALCTFSYVQLIIEIMIAHCQNHQN